MSTEMNYSTRSHLNTTSLSEAIATQIETSAGNCDGSFGTSYAEECHSGGQSEVGSSDSMGSYDDTYRHNLSKTGTPTSDESPYLCLLSSDDEDIQLMFSWSQGKAHLLDFVLGKDHIEQLARETGFIERNTGFKPCAYVAAMLGVSLQQHQGDSKRVKCLWEAYNKENQKMNPLAKAIQKTTLFMRINKPEALIFALKLVNEFFTACKEYFSADKLGGITAWYQENVLEEHGFNDLALTDGTCVPVVSRTEKEMDCKAAGRKLSQRATNSSHCRANSSEAKAVKAHVRFDLLRFIPDMAFLGSGVSPELPPVQEMTDSESISIHDRASDSREHRQKMRSAGRQYIYRGRTNHTFTITKASDDEGHSKPELVGKKLRDVERGYGVLDLVVNSGTKQKPVLERVILSERPKQAKKEGSYHVLFTSLEKSQLPASLAILYYELRWAQECTCFKNLKSTCSFCCVNSGKKEIIVSFLCFAWIAFAIKYWFWAASQSRLYSKKTENPEASSFNRNPAGEIERIARAALDPKADKVRLPPMLSFDKVFRHIDVDLLMSYIRDALSGKERTTLWRDRTAITDSLLNPAGDFFRDNVAYVRTLRGRKDIRVKLAVICYESMHRKRRSPQVA